MTKLYRRVELKEGVPVQFLGVYVLRWKPEWGEPQIGLVEEFPDEVIHAIVKVANLHDARGTWHGRSNDFWFKQGVEELLELCLSLDGKHIETPELELTQIASWAINFIRKIRREEMKERSNVAGKDSADVQVVG